MTPCVWIPASSLQRITRLHQLLRWC